MAARWVLLVLLVGCIESDLVLCADGRACAVGFVCDDVHATCVTPAQIAACTDQPDAVACDAAPRGQCFDGVCFEPGCGNHVVEPTEQCDDGNFTSGDGCAADCTSNETCNNGVVDPGEGCDDGNLVSHDGCSSQCRVEARTWSALMLGVTGENGGPVRFAFDEARDVLVAQGMYSTWEWDGISWSIKELSSARTWNELVYDRARQRVVGVNGTLLADWDGTTWTQHSGSAPFSIEKVTYDAKCGCLFIASDKSTAWFDAANDQVKPGPDLPITPVQMSLGYDSVRNQILMMDQAGASTTYTLATDGSTWSSFTGSPLRSGMAIVDGGALGTFAVGGTLSSTEDSKSIYLWTGSSWAEDAAGGAARQFPFVWFTPSTLTLHVIGGRSSQGGRTGVYTVTASGATTPTDQVDANIVTSLAYDSARDRLLLGDNRQQLWKIDATGPTFLAPRPSAMGFPSASVFDPVRGTLVRVDSQSGGWEFGDTWQQTTAPSVGEEALSGTYDYARRRVVLSGANGTYALGSADTSWTTIANAGIGATSMAYDVGLQRVVGLSDPNSGGLYSLDATDMWIPSLAPGRGYSAVSALERQAVLLLSGGPFATSQSFEWEWRDSQFTSIGRSPLPGLFATPHTSAWSRGRSVITLLDGGVSLALVHQLTSTTPDESCVDGEDVDGDGASGCSDPDCWQQCFPACPLATTSCL